MTAGVQDISYFVVGEVDDQSVCEVYLHVAPTRMAIVSSKDEARMS
jgi:hypothetical protein